MLYYLFKYLDELDFPGAGVFRYISFRSAVAVILSLLISMYFGKRIIEFLRKKQIGETVRDLGLEGQMQKQGTPTMGGLIIIAAIVIPVILLAQLDNIYILMLLFSTIILGFIGFLDDYIKVFKKDKKGLSGKFKIIGQLVVGIMVASTLYFHEDVVVKRKKVTDKVGALQVVELENDIEKRYSKEFEWKEEKSLVTTIPFLKNNEFDYSLLIAWLGDDYRRYSWLIFIPVVIFIITAVSNGANITDGLDGLAAGSSAIIGVTLAVFAYVSGNTIFADYLNIMYIPHLGEMVIFISAFVGACVGFLWYNSYPAQVFMGDTGSLTLGGIIAVFSLAVRKELLIPVFCGVFLIENLSVVLQVSYFKYTKRKYGEGRRIFLMSPLHHHYQKKGMHEAKIVTRFWIVGIMLAILSIVTLKIR